MDKRPGDNADGDRQEKEKRLQITLDLATGKVQITGNVMEKIFCLGALELAKLQLLKTWADVEKSGQPIILPARGGLPRA